MEAHKECWRFPKEKNFISRSSVDVFIPYEIQTNGGCPRDEQR